MPNPNHGGSRKGAGRPPTGKPRRVKIAITVAPDLLAKADAEAERRGVTRSALFETAITHELDDSSARPDEPRAGA